MVQWEGSRLVAARRKLGLTRSAFARAIGVASLLVAKWEEGLEPTEPQLHAIAGALEVPVGFLLRPEISTTEVAAITFRRRQDAVRATKERAAVAVDLAYHDLLPLMRTTLGSLPFPDLPDLHGLRPEAAAQLLREMWGIGDLPIKSIVSLLEAKGVRVFYTSDPSPSLSAFTKWIEGEPLLFLNTSISDGCRHRFNTAHELAHLVLHRDVNFETTDARAIEREADAFASAFVLGRQFLREAPPTFRPDDFLALKPRWGASMGAMVRRLRDSGVMTEWQYESAVIWLSKQGYRSNPEPQAGSIEMSVLQQRMVDQWLADDHSPEMVADDMGFPLPWLEELVPAARAARLSLRLPSHDSMQAKPFDGDNTLAHFED